MTKGTKHIYFASDFHLGMFPREDSRKRERNIVDWLRSIEDHADELWLMGDIFDYWYEYKKVVPRGFIRFIGKLAELADKGVKIHIFAGNHDVWYFDYFPEEIGAEIHHEAILKTFEEKTFYLSHGDGLTKKDRTYLLIKAMFKSKVLQWFYTRIHPNGSAAFAQWWSKKSRYGKDMVHPYKGDEQEEQVIFARNYLKEQPDIDFFIFGHRHMPFDVKIGDKTRVICLGDWISSFTYGVFDGNEFCLLEFKME